MNLAWLKQLSIDYRERFTCDICKELEPSKQVIIADGTALGQLKHLFADYTPPIAEGAPVMREQRCAFHLHPHIRPLGSSAAML